MHLFDRALEFVKTWEGGFVNHPADPGGATNQGITQVTYSAWRSGNGLPSRSVAQATESEIRAIYQTIWGGRPDDLEQMGLYNCALVTFDLFVQSGEHGGTQLIQRALGNLAVDGAWGPRTWARFLESVDSRGDLGTAIRIISERVIFRGERVTQAPSQRVFLLGWLRRDADLLRQLR